MPRLTTASCLSNKVKKRIVYKENISLTLMFLILGHYMYYFKIVKVNFAIFIKLFPYGFYL